MALAAPPPQGNYFNIFYLAIMVVLLLPWLYLAPHIAKDALRLHAPHVMWSMVILGSGALGFVVWLLLPFFFVGMMMYVVLVLTSMGAYVAYHNSHVPDDQKLLTSAHFSRLFQRRKATVTVAPRTKLKLYTCESKSVPPPADDDTSVTIYNLAQEFLYNMVWRRASEVDILPSGSEARVRFVIDGMAVDQPSMNLVDSEAMIQFLKPVAGMNAEDRRRPQKGMVVVDLAQGPTEIAVACAGTTGGQRMQFRIRSEVVQTSLDGLGMSPTVLKRVKAVLEGPGLLILSGRPGSGITSSLYSVLREHDAFTQQIVSFEKTPAVELENVTQAQYADEDFAASLASAVRRDPDVILIDECTTPEGAKLIAETAAAKALLLGMHASDAFVALAKWVKICEQADVAVKSLKGILCQMLLRKLCPTCREAYRPDPGMLAKANLSAAQVSSFYRTPTRPQTDEKGNPIICETCQGSGYFGRTAAFELLEVTDELRAAVIQGENLTQIKAICRKNKMLYLQEQALAKVISGMTSIQEVIRVSQQAQAKK